MTNFKKNDRVVLSDASDMVGYPLTIGKEYTVQEDQTGTCVAVKDDKGCRSAPFAWRFKLVASADTFKVGDKVVIKDSQWSDYWNVRDVTRGRTYTLATTSADGDGKFQLVYFVNDEGRTVNSYASRVDRATSNSIEQAREQRKLNKANRKAAGVARAATIAALAGPVAKKPMLFAELTATQVHAAIAKHITGMLPGLSGVKVLGLEKTTEGYKVNLGQYA
ncbi:hypothetical protein [Rhizobium sp. BK376]|uniref:hypothetical protein n=1 Tax=Rhizobium sp. BK376 TaxID=2512149 RepID=UPI00104AA2C1|nr:hypothetical protein [Rhizobium sp. BK376]TCR92606.1 hypothetical protein EV561_10139 [Rhizobium sp. BK376]